MPSVTTRALLPSRTRGSCSRRRRFAENALVVRTEGETRRSPDFVLLVSRRGDNIHALHIPEERTRRFDTKPNQDPGAIDQGGTPVKKQDFDDIVKSVKQAG